ncbi:unnamed protein product [Lactuca virosa]|uniref:Ubiquitin-like protease family profile domain-containing protein n=1 Tax=Lactuca virosa TaxID=75947 RepID=A0AAU9NRY5_9ASTR|nr:unnamed protein product [Lactuca virosa]
MIYKLSTKIQCEDGLFDGSECYTYITWDDFEIVFTMDKLNGVIINSYMMYLYEEIKNGGKTDHGICFVSPSAISKDGRTNNFKKSDEASEVIACRLSTRKDNNIILMSYNPGALSLHTRQSGSKKKVKASWINVMCPFQPGYTECGYYVLKFMKEVVDEGLEVLNNNFLSQFWGKNEYTYVELDRVREEWATYVINFLY